jgi:hypothetical protein
MNKKQSTAAKMDTNKLMVPTLHNPDNVAGDNDDL